MKRDISILPSIELVDSVPEFSASVAKRPVDSDRKQIRPPRPGRKDPTPQILPVSRPLAWLRHL
jgi:hypothetical protein